MERYSVRVATPDLVFCAAHFITYGDGQCERLHGHNYQASVEIAGPLDAHHCVVDFVAVHDMLRAILDAWDHRVILPTQHPRLRVTVADGEATVRDAERRWVFPQDDCLLLPVPNTTAERLAACLAAKLREAVVEKTGCRPETLRVEVQEQAGFVGVCTLS